MAKLLMFDGAGQGVTIDEAADVVKWLAKI
jgi:hypothetical protein